MEDDYRLVAARKQAWNENAWREPAFLALVISGLKGFLAEGPENPDSRAEAKYLISTLYQAGKTPASRNANAH